MIEEKPLIEKAILVYALLSDKDDSSFSLSELTRLADTAGIEVLTSVTQKVREITPATLIGKGKVEEIAELVQSQNANIVIFNNELSGSQTSNLADAFGVKVVDRTTLILDIFARRATTSEGKLQVELAQLKYFLPRLSGISGSTGRYGSGGVGMRGPGEKKLELDKRSIQNSILRLEREIAQIKKNRNLNISKRNANNIKKVAIVGYTNAGKSTLLNLLTKATTYADDKLFATLETTTRKLWFALGQECVVTDTVGFVDKLPHAFVDAFSATLSEARDSDLILHVVDASDPNLDTHMEVVNGVLKDIGASDIPTLIVFNKIDAVLKISDIKSDKIYISALKNQGIETLKEKIINVLWP